jgi:hypothetical protein
LVDCGPTRNQFAGRLWDTENCRRATSTLLSSFTKFASGSRLTGSCRQSRATPGGHFSAILAWSRPSAPLPRSSFATSRQGCSTCTTRPAPLISFSAVATMSYSPSHMTSQALTSREPLAHTAGCSVTNSRSGQTNQHRLSSCPNRPSEGFSRSATTSGAILAGPKGLRSSRAPAVGALATAAHVSCSDEHAGFDLLLYLALPSTEDLRKPLPVVAGAHHAAQARSTPHRPRRPLTIIPAPAR